jgi:hypothetical protein
MTPAKVTEALDGPGEAAGLPGSSRSPAGRGGLDCGRRSWERGSMWEAARCGPRPPIGRGGARVSPHSCRTALTISAKYFYSKVFNSKLPFPCAILLFNGCKTRHRIDLRSGPTRVPFTVITTYRCKNDEA